MPGAEQQLTLVPCKLGGSAEAALCNARALMAGVEGAAHLSDSDRPSLLLAHLLHEERFSATDVLLKDLQCQVASDQSLGDDEWDLFCRDTTHAPL